jgi:hypothetical protein
MAHDKIIHAIKIPLDVVVAQDTALGIYTSGGVSEIRWSENVLNGTEQAWTSGIIAEGGLGAWKESANLEQGGAPAIFDGFTISTIHTNQLTLQLEALGIKLTNLPCERWEFSGTETDSDATYAKRIYSGVYEDCTWDEIIAQIPVKTDTYKRRACMGTVINNCPAAQGGNFPLASDDKNGTIAPITIGTFLPDAEDASENILAKFVRVAEKQTIFNNDFDTLDPEIFPDCSGYFTPQGIDTFPIVGAGEETPHLDYYVKLGGAAFATIADVSALFVGKYLKVVAGGSAASEGVSSVSMVGKYRKIVSVSVNGLDETVMQFHIDSFFEKDLDFNGSATADNNVWVQIIDIPFEFKADIWPCYGFLNEVGGSISQEARLFSYFSTLTSRFKTKFDLVDGIYVPSEEAMPEGFLQIPQYGYSIIGSSPNNSLIIDVKMFKGDPSKMSSLSIFPIKNFAKHTIDDIAKLFNSEYTNLIGESNWFGGHLTTLEQTDYGTIANVTDKLDAGSFGQTLHSYDGAFSAAAAICVWSFDLPIDKILISYDAFYLGINIDTKTEFMLGDEYDLIRFLSGIFWKRFIGKIPEIASYLGSIGNRTAEEIKYNDWTASGGGYAQIDNIPDFYYTLCSTPSNDKRFYFETTVENNVSDYCGHQNFKLNDLTTEQLKSIYKMYYAHGYEWTAHHTNQLLHSKFIHEMALICEKEFDLGSTLYAMFTGRVYDDTWGNRKTATDCIDNPPDIFEHFCRLQNYSDTGDNVIWGKQYAPSAKIKLSGDGSFDDPGLDPLRALRPAFQILDENEAYTDEAKKKMCEQYFLLSRQDEDGYECLHYLDPQGNDTTIPSDTVTLADCIPGSIGEVQEPKAENIFVEPFVNYAYNIGSDSYDRQLRVVNVSDAAWIGTGTVENPQYAAGSGWHAEYTPGFKGTDGKSIWENRNLMWKKFRNFESPPSNKTDCRKIKYYADALYYIKDWTAWDGKRRRSFALEYLWGTARDWHPGTKINWNNPHQTSSFNVRCMVENIKKDKNTNRIDVDIIILDTYPTYGDLIIETGDAPDTITESGDAPDTITEN